MYAYLGRIYATLVVNRDMAPICRSTQSCRKTVVQVSMNRGGFYMGKLEGKIALVTGGNSGIGLATAKQFVSEGAYVFITARRNAQLAAVVKEIGRNVTGVQGDVSNLGDLDRLFAQIKREKGKLDIVFANAGVAKYAPLRQGHRGVL